MSRQYRIRIRAIHGRNSTADRYVRDERGNAPSYAWFDETSLDQAHVVASWSIARRVRDDYADWCRAKAPAGLASVPTQLILEAVDE